MKVAIVNDLPLAIEALTRALALRPQHRICWVAKHGREAVELCAQDTPDLVLLDLLMPEMDGVEATRRIMAATPCPILIVTVNVGINAGRVFEAMGHGAVDAIDTPALAGDIRTGAAPLLAKLDSIEQQLQTRGDNGEKSPLPPRSRSVSLQDDWLVAIGASAGGPAAVLSVLRNLPRDFPAGVVVIQHVDQSFASGMVEWLARHSALPVKLAQAGCSATERAVWIAGRNEHLVLEDATRLSYTAEPRSCIYRPSVDVFFESVSRHWRGRAIGVLLTGMGSDGARGLKGLRDCGHHTIAQDRRTSAVYGMPKAAVELDAAVDVLPVDRIAARLMDHFTARAAGDHHVG